MDSGVDIYMHYGGVWRSEPIIEYVGGHVHILPCVDIENATFDILKEDYGKYLGHAQLDELYVLFPGMSAEDGFIVVNDDEGIRKVIENLDVDSDILQFYPVHDIDLHCKPNCITISELDPFIERLINTQNSMVRSDFEGLTNTQPGDDSEDEKSEEEIDGAECDSSEESDVEFPSEGRELVPIRSIVDDNRSYFDVGMTFPHANAVREAISKYCVSRKKKVKYDKNEPIRIRVSCPEKGCEFKLLVSKHGKNLGLMVKTLTSKHDCQNEVFLNPWMTARRLAKHYKQRIINNHKYRVKDLKADAEEEFNISVSVDKCKRAKRLILEEYSGIFTNEYNELEAYAEELLDKNRGSVVNLDLMRNPLKSGHRQFKRMFICLDACKRGWLGGCRRFIGLDGCFLKTKFEGELLVAVGKDANEQNYPIAWACVKSESESNWNWFLTLLRDALDLRDGEDITFMADKSKGFDAAVKKLLPKSEQRTCARHIYANWSKENGGEELKNTFWKCAWSTYHEDFLDNLKLVGAISEEAAKDLVGYKPEKWCRAYCSGRSKCWAVDNNLTESFNSWILEARHKPIRSMLECIRKKVMVRLALLEHKVGIWIGNFSPYAIDIFQVHQTLAVGCKVEFNGDNGFEIKERLETHIVDLKTKRCTCRVWDLSGIPCQHAIAALRNVGQDPKHFISQWYSQEAYKAAYRHKIQTVRSKTFYNMSDKQPIDPPPIKTKRGRRRLKRIREHNEPRSGSGTTNLSRKGRVISCSRCHKPGHNKSTCKAILGECSNTSNIEDLTLQGEEDANLEDGENPENVGSLGDSSNLAAELGLSLDDLRNASIEKRKKTTNYERRAMSRLHNMSQQSTGSFTWQGDNTTEVLSQGESVLEDLNTNFPIPNEREIQAERVTNMIMPISSSSAKRTIAFRGDGEAPDISSLPYQPRKKLKPIRKNGPAS